MLDYSIFHPIIKSTFGFRECSTLIKIAQQTNSYIEIIANNKKGNTNSILSLMQLGIVKDTPIIFTVKGTNQIECVHKIMDLLNEGWQPEDLNLINQSINKENDNEKIEDIIKKNNDEDVKKNQKINFKKFQLINNRQKSNKKILRFSDYKYKVA